MNSKVAIEGMVKSAPIVNKDGTTLAVITFNGRDSVRIVASGPVADSLGTFLAGHPIGVIGELACDSKGIFVLVRVVAVGRR